MKISDLPLDVLRIVSNFCVNVIYLNYSKTIIEQKLCSTGFAEIKKFDRISERISALLMGNKKYIRLQGLVPFERKSVYTLCEIYKLKAEKIKIPYNTCGLCNGYYKGCDCCDKPPCIRCRGTGMSRGYYASDLIVRK